ncbi:Trafficking protein particle complex subunit 10 [Sarcoptes scabiei]|uniref:Trafficking protein particle complex subunit 10 n=1 Tax=Sarcoptes scabiei TaxID=52283 RepID=A0A834RHK6_SARSC|nr:Trafficking protein particle complex subunit 10 [Sarcoptes scabiei]
MNDRDRKKFLITVQGELDSFVLNSYFGDQIRSFLSKESVDLRIEHLDSNPIAINIEADFIKFDQKNHLLLDNLDESVELTQSKYSNDSNRNVPLRRQRSLNAQSFEYAIEAKKFHSNKSRQLNEPIHRPQSVSPDCMRSVSESNGHRKLFHFLACQSLLNNESRVLLNSYWLDSNHDLTSYTQNVRSSLMDWFNKIMVHTVATKKIGLNHSFLLEFFVVVVIRVQHQSKHSISSDSKSSQSKEESSKQLLSPEFILELDQLNSQKFKIDPLKKQPKSFERFDDLKTMKENPKEDKNHPQKQIQSNNFSNTTISSSSTTSSMSLLQLLDQIRNDLLTCLKTFHSNLVNNTDSNLKKSPIINEFSSDLSRLIDQIVDRIIIFDSTSDASNSYIERSSPKSSQNLISSMNPLIYTTAKTLSALSNFSTNSLKLNSTSKILSSPSKSSSKVSSLTQNGALETNHTSALNFSKSITFLNFSQFIVRIRQFLIETIEKRIETLKKSIDVVRGEQNHPLWDYFGFFLLQEELALIYEYIGLFNQSLFQYDELDALFLGLLHNQNHYDAPSWFAERFMKRDLSEDIKSNQTYTSRPYENIEPIAILGYDTGLCLCNKEFNRNLRMQIVNSVLSFNSSARNFLMNPSSSPVCQNTLKMQNFRNYIFFRQFHLLCLADESHQLASRALPFLYSSRTVFNSLETSVPAEKIACWNFLSALEILREMEKHSDIIQNNALLSNMVNLWSFVRDNLIALGMLCRLMFESKTDQKAIDSSSHLHQIVELIALMGSDPHIKTNDDQFSPQERLKDALLSVDSFRNYYVKITEKIIRIYKRIGYMRSAFYLSKQLAIFICKKSQQPLQALWLLLNLHQIYAKENWAVLERKACFSLTECLVSLSKQFSDFTSMKNSYKNFKSNIRSLFQAYLMLLVESEQFFEADLSSIDNFLEECLHSMSILCDQYKKYGTEIKKFQNYFEHNLLNTGLSMKDFPLLILKNSSLLCDEFEEKVTKIDSSSSFSQSFCHPLSDCETSKEKFINFSANNRRTIGCRPAKLFQIENITIFGEKLNESAEINEFIKKDGFLATGSILKLKLKIFSHINLRLNLKSIIFTLRCNKRERPNKAIDSKILSKESISDFVEPSSSDFSPHSNTNDSITPSDSDQCSMEIDEVDNYRFLKSSYKFESLNSQADCDLFMSSGINEYEIYFKSPKNLESIACDGNAKLMTTKKSIYRLEQSFVLRLNSGTNYLPKGSTFSFEFKSICSKNDFTLDGSESSLSINFFSNEKENKNQVEHLKLDRDLGPFQTMEINLILTSQYTRPKQLCIRKINQSNDYLKSVSVEQFEYEFTLQHHNPDDSNSPIYQIKSFHFVLIDPFVLIPKIYSIGKCRKFLQLQLISFKSLSSDIDLIFREPLLQIDKKRNSIEFQINRINNLQHQSNDQTDTIPYRLNRDNSLNFSWYFDTASNINKLELNCIVEFNRSTDSLIRSKTRFTYQISINFDCATLLSIRQWIEPLTKDSIRLNSPCLLKVRIEKLGDFVNSSSNFCGDLMYDLVCDQNIWAFVSNYSPSIDSKEIEQNQEKNDDQNLNDYEATSREEKNVNDQEVIFKSDTGIIRFDRSSNDREQTENKLIKISFVISPLITGFLPLPILRLSQCKVIQNEKYIDSNSESKHESVEIESTKKFEEQQENSHRFETSTTVSFENFSIKNREIKNQYSNGSYSEEFNCKNICLEPFETGQIYYYNRANQIYVSPIVGCSTSD